MKDGICSEDVRVILRVFMPYLAKESTNMILLTNRWREFFGGENDTWCEYRLTLGYIGIFIPSGLCSVPIL